MSKDRNIKDPCELVLFHSTTKENLKGIMKEGIKPGMKGGWCDLMIKKLEKMVKEKEIKKETAEEEISEIEDIKKVCQEEIFMSANIHDLERKMPKGSDTIIVTCVPKKNVRVMGMPFDKWIETGGTLQEYMIQTEVTTKDIIPPENIIGCLDIEEKKEKGPNFVTKFRANKECSR